MQAILTSVLHRTTNDAYLMHARAALPSLPPPHGDRGHIDANTDIVHGAAEWDARGGMGVARCAPPSLVIPPRSAPPEGHQSRLGAEAQRRHHLHPHILSCFCGWRTH